MVAQFPAQAQSLRTCPLPLGGAVAQRLRGFKSAEPEKTVKRSSRRTGVNLQFFPVEPSSLGLKGASSPFFVAPARRNRWHFSGSLLVSKENIHGLPPPPPPLCAKGCFLSNQHAIIDESCYFLYTKLIGAGTIFLLCQWLLNRNSEGE